MSEQKILRTEIQWSLAVAAAIAVIVAVISVSSFTMAMHPPSHVESVDPTTLSVNPEFSESNLGTQVNSDGSVTVRVVATQFAFVPRCIPVPENRPVTFRVTSPDVIHGFIIAGTNANTMIVPGYVSEVRTAFSQPGDHLMPCHEYCGLGHSEMWSMVRVLAPSEWKTDANGRATCEIPR